MDMENIDFGKLKEAIKALNEVEGLLAKAELSNIKTVAQKKEAMVSLFTDAIEKLSEVGAEEEIPEIAIEMYNSMHGEEVESKEEETEDDDDDSEDIEEETEEEEEEEEEEEITEEMDEEGNVVEKKKEKKEKAPKKEKKEKVPKEKKEKKEKVPKEKKPKKERVITRSCYGQLASALSGKLDEMMKVGSTYGEIMKALDVNRGRIQSHMKALKNMGLTVMVKEDEDPYKTYIKVKEDSLVRPPKEKTV